MAKVSPANTHKQSTLASSLSLSLLQEALASHPSQNLASSWALPDRSATSLRLVHHGPDTVSAWLPSTPFRSRKVAIKEGSDGRLGRRDMSPSTERRSHRRLSAAPVPWPLHSVAGRYGSKSKHFFSLSPPGHYRDVIVADNVSSEEAKN